jgi:hypothetical protein
MSGLRWTWAMIGFGLLAGCEQPAQPRQQHRELRRINSEGVYIVPRVTDKTPIRFGHASVEVVGPNNSTLGSRSSWEPTVPAEAFVKHFLPEEGKAQLSKIVLRCRYFDENGAPTGSDDVASSFHKEAPEYRGRIQFASLGVNGPVARIDVEVVKVVYLLGGEEREVDLTK